jgi:hypothetical protein
VDADYRSRPKNEREIEMKKLLAIVLCTIILAIASPVYAQGDTGYPVDDLSLAPCSASYGMGPITPAACVAYYEVEYPDIATGCGEYEPVECVAYYESLLIPDVVEQVIYDDVVETAYVNLAESADSTPDVAAGGEGPIIVWSMTDIIGIAFGGLLLTVALIFIVGNAISEWAKNKRK